VAVYVVAAEVKGLGNSRVDSRGVRGTRVEVGLAVGTRALALALAEDWAELKALADGETECSRVS